MNTRSDGKHSRPTAMIRLWKKSKNQSIQSQVTAQGP